jgi:transcriptional regulator with XRE-family HTH domain
MSKFQPITDNDLAAALGQRLKAARLKAGLSIEKMADDAKVARRAYLEWEHGRTLPRLDSLIRVCNLHNLPIEAMFKAER